MTVEEAIERVERMLEEATPGPWRLSFSEQGGPGQRLWLLEGPEGKGPHVLFGYTTGDKLPPGRKADARLIAQFRTLLPAMLEVVRATTHFMRTTDDSRPAGDRVRSALARFSQEVEEK